MTPRFARAFRTYLLLLPLLASSSGAFAVSLGDELILSALGDPVEVEIEVLQWEDMDLDRVQISAASREEYDVFKLTWLPVLEHLNFNLVGPDLNGKVRVLVSSRDPLDEPFLELLLVLRWPGGSLRREYVLLFDPPGTPARALSAVTTPPADGTQTPPQNAQALPQLPLIEDPAPALADVPPEEVAIEEGEEAIEEPATPAIQAPTVSAARVAEERLPVVEEPGSEEVAEAPPKAEPPQLAANVVAEVSAAEPVATTTPAPPATATPPAPVQPEAEEELDARTTVAVDVERLAPQPAAPEVPADSGRRIYQVRSGESLWNIARQFRPAGAGENLYQVLLSIHNLNRGSFINGNISLLKANAVLQVPTVADIEGVDAASAQTEFERRWDQGTQRVEAAQRGEAIPLFADDPPTDDAVPEIENRLPPGVEAPPLADAEDALIMVSETNVPLPLQIAGDAGADVAAGDSGSSSADSSTSASAPAPATSAASAAPLPVVTTQAQTPPPTAPESATLSLALTPPATVAASSDPATDETRATTRALVTSQLETEVAAMRARRESAEAIAQQLQASLEKARAERAAQASLFGTENLLLGGGAVMLFGLLAAGIAATLRLAGDLRSLRAGSSVALHPQTDNERLAGIAGSRPQTVERKEPVMPEMEVVELPASALAAASAAVPTQAPPQTNADDLFARMDDILGADSANPAKNS